jgi:hypothetical protein
MASTYPLEVVQAERWASENKSLKGDQLKAAVDKQSWDDSVKSLAATPDVLTMMSTKLDWTQKLGDAVLAQQPDLMDAVQRLRSKAQANDKLKSTKEQNVTVKQVEQKQAIVIEPTEPNTIHVPYYDPAVAYGEWPYSDYPPYYFPAPGYIAGGILATGIAFGAGYALGRWASGGNYWGGGCNWGRNNIVSNRPININNAGNNWQHRPEHRQGVKYNNASVQQKFGNQAARAGSDARMDFRGRSGDQVLKPGGDKAGARDRAGNDRGPGNAGRPSDRGTNASRPGTGDRGAGANRPSTGDRGAKQSASKPSNRGATQHASSRSGASSRGPSRDSAFNVQSRGAAQAHAQRGQASLGGGTRGGGSFAHAGGGGGRSFGGGGGGRGGGGRRSDIALKHDIVLLARLDNGLGFYRFAYNGQEKLYVGVMAQEVQSVMPTAVVRGRDGYLRVHYDKIGVKFQSHEQWVASGSHLPTAVHPPH